MNAWNKSKPNIFLNYFFEGSKINEFLWGFWEGWDFWTTLSIEALENNNIGIAFFLNF